MNHNGDEDIRTMSETHVEMKGHNKERFKGVANEEIIVRGRIGRDSAKKE